MDLRLLRSFVAVAEELHFGRAAERVFIAQSTLSQQIRQLEDEHGVRLFDRTRRSVALTDAGRVLLPHARRVLRESEQAAEALQAAKGGLAGRLRIGYRAELMRGMLPEAIRRFREIAPAVDLELHEIVTDQQPDALRSGEIDIGSVLYPFEAAGLASRPFETSPLTLLVPSDHALADQASVAVSDLRDEPHVEWARETTLRAHDAYFDLCRAEGFEPRIAQTVWDVESCLGFVAAGLGVAPADGLIASIPRDGVVAVPFVPEFPIIRGLIWRVDTPGPVVERFLDVCEAVHPRSSLDFP